MASGMATRWAAGVLPVAVEPVTGTTVVLLGLDAADKGGKWSDFAGGGEAEDASPRHTALREFFEETGGALELTLDDLHNALEFRGVTPSGKALHRFVVCVPFDPELPKRFKGSKDDEKTALGWFPLDAPPPLRRVFGVQLQRDAPIIHRALKKWWQDSRA